jgi:hypothetical protein
MYIGLIAMSFYKFKQFERNEKIIEEGVDLNNVERMESQKLESWKFLKADLRPNCHKFWKFIDQIQILKEVLTGFFVIVFIENVYLQIVPLLVMFLFLIFGLLVYRPYKSKFQNLFKAFMEFFYFLIFSVFLMLEIGSKSIPQAQRYNIWGFSVLLMIAFIILVHIGLAVVSVVKKVRKYFKNRKKDKKKVRKESFGFGDLDIFAPDDPNSINK